jgi:hypothetical protein
VIKNIDELKALKALLKLCRKEGVTELSLAGTVIKFGELPEKSAKSEDEDDDGKEIPTDELTPEQLMFFSVGGVPPA